MGFPTLVPIPAEGDWAAVRRSIAKLAGPKLGVGASPTFNSLILTGSLALTGTLTLSSASASRLLSTNASKALVSTDLFSWVAGTTNQVTVADDADGTITLSTPQNIHTGASPTFADLTLSAPSNIYALSHNSFADFVSNKHIDHTTVSITGGGILSGGGDISANRTITLAHGDVDHDQTANVHQNVNTVANPTFDGINLTDTDDLIQVATTTILKVVGTGNYAIGASAGGAITTETYNTLFGASAGASLAAQYCVCIGAFAGQNVTGDNNVCVGTNAGVGIVAGAANLAMGSQAMQTVGGASGYNVALGLQALKGASNTVTNNVAIGAFSCAASTTGTNNVGLGYATLQSVTSGQYNVAIGGSSGNKVTTAIDNMSLGYVSLFNNTGAGNTAIGARSGYTKTSGDGNIFIGRYAGYYQATPSNILLVDNQQRASAAVELTNSIIYGVMAASPANQTLQFNADILFGVGGGLAFGSFKGNEIAWTQASAAQNTYYTVSDSDIAAGQLNGGTTFDNNQEITVPNTGYYLVTYYIDCEVSIANKHILASIEVNGTEVADGRAHIEIDSANTQKAVCGVAILSLNAADAVSIGISTTDTGTPNISVDHIGLTVVQIGG